MDFTNGGSGYVRTWYDQSGNQNHANQPTLANQPSFSFDMGGNPIINPRVRFLSASSRYLIPANYNNSMDFLESPLSLFVAFYSTLTTTGYFLAKNTDAVTNMQYGFYHDGANQVLSSCFENTGHNSNTVLKSAHNKSVISWDGENINYYNNGLHLNQVAQATTLTNRENILIGARASTSGGRTAFFNGYIRSLILFKTALNQAQIKECQSIANL